jgi:hypothetical protein
MDKIYVQIASYRDPELVPTMRDCIAKAKHPERLAFGICWQNDETESLKEFATDKRVRVINIPWQESRGLCWARSLIQKLWLGEKYTMQLDSHHRFLQDWDEHLIKMMELTGSPKPIITAYAGMYEPEKDGPGKILNTNPYKMIPGRFTPTGTILFFPHAIENYEALTKPINARFVSGHFYFTLGIHCQEYKYDPNIYFAGDEISLSIRSYTLGYDLFHPHYTVVWHEYTRQGRVKHWDDFTETNVKAGVVHSTWHDMDIASKRRLRHMLQEEDNNIDLGEYGLGKVRSHSDYETYAGINFKLRRLHPTAKEGIDPPTKIENDDWLKIVDNTYKFDATWDLNAIKKEADEFSFWYFGVEDEIQKVIYRRDFNPAANPDVFNGMTTRLSVEFNSTSTPYKWVLWPVSKDGKWLNKIEHVLESKDFR